MRSCRGVRRVGLTCGYLLQGHMDKPGASPPVKDVQACTDLTGNGDGSNAGDGSKAGDKVGGSARCKAAGHGQRYVSRRNLWRAIFRQTANEGEGNPTRRPGATEASARPELVRKGGGTTAPVQRKRPSTAGGANPHPVTHGCATTKRATSPVQSTASMGRTNIPIGLLDVSGGQA
jgi:ribosomal protein S14